MIAFLKGTIAEKLDDSLVIEAGGVGYEVFMSQHSLARAGAPGTPVSAFISESTAMYGGGTTLYGFLHRDEKEIFLALRDNVPGTGAKKALEYLDKAAKSLPDFRRAILEGDERILTGVFGFTKKTAEKLVAALKDKLGRLGHAHRQQGADGAVVFAGGTKTMQQALDALLGLGYKPAEARQALQSFDDRDATVEEIIRYALKQLKTAR